MDTPLQLDDYYFPHVRVSAVNTVGDPAANYNKDFEVDINVADQQDENGDKVYQVALRIRSYPASEEEMNLYLVELVVVGLFRVHPEFDNPIKLLEVNGASILYSSAREFLITISARGPWGQITLPTKSFLRMYNEKNSDEKTDSEDSEERDTN